METRLGRTLLPLLPGKQAIGPVAEAPGELKLELHQFVPMSRKSGHVVVVMVGAIRQR